MLTGRQLDSLREKLQQEKHELETYIERNDRFGMSDAQGETTGELSTYDNHPADSATELYEREKDVALNENAERHLEDVNAALRRIEEGTYGTCASCGAPIPFERLEALPSAKNCAEHSDDRFVSARRPVEERFMTPAFGRTSLDERSDQNGFDGEDAWQIVASWGTSNTPAMSESAEADDYGNMYLEADEADGYVEPIESFLATDLYGKEVAVVRNHAYRKYMEGGEGDRMLEYDDDDIGRDDDAQ